MVARDQARGLFPNTKDPSRPLCHCTVQRAVRVAAARAGLGKKVREGHAGGEDAIAQDDAVAIADDLTT